MQQEKPELNMSDFEAGEEFIPDITSGTKIKKDPWREKELIFKYNKTFIRLMNRDPNRLFTYWEVNNPVFYQQQPLLRLFSEKEGIHFDIEINHNSDNWYIAPVKGSHTYRIAIGYLQNGIFHPLSYSNRVNTPSDRPSEILDQKWMSIEDLTACYYLEINATLGYIKSLEKRKREEGLNIDSYSFIRHRD
ncbi:MAG: DUF4912 domain-containing protein [Halanaerobiales bacterium]